MLDNVVASFSVKYSEGMQGEQSYTSTHSDAWHLEESAEKTESLSVPSHY